MQKSCMSQHSVVGNTNDLVLFKIRVNKPTNLR